jgi:hypothetical protein
VVALINNIVAYWLGSTGDLRATSRHKLDQQTPPCLLENVSSLQCVPVMAFARNFQYCASVRRPQWMGTPCGAPFFCSICNCLLKLTIIPSQTQIGCRVSGPMDPYLTLPPEWRKGKGGRDRGGGGLQAADIL